MGAAVGPVHRNDRLVGGRPVTSSPVLPDRGQARVRIWSRNGKGAQRTGDGSPSWSGRAVRPCVGREGHELITGLAALPPDPVVRDISRDTRASSVVSACRHRIHRTKKGISRESTDLEPRRTRSRRHRGRATRRRPAVDGRRAGDSTGSTTQRRRQRQGHRPSATSRSTRCPSRRRRPPRRRQRSKRRLKGDKAMRGKVAKVGKGQYVELEREAHRPGVRHARRVRRRAVPRTRSSRGRRRTAAPPTSPGRCTTRSPSPTAASTTPRCGRRTSTSPTTRTCTSTAWRSTSRRQSSNRYSVEGDVNGWVKVPFNEALYGRNYCGDIVCNSTKALVRDAMAVWVQQQLDAGKTATADRRLPQAVRRLGPLRPRR